MMDQRLGDASAVRDPDPTAACRTLSVLEGTLRATQSWTDVNEVARRWTGSEAEFACAVLRADDLAPLDPCYVTWVARGVPLDRLADLVRASQHIGGHKVALLVDALIARVSLVQSLDDACQLVLWATRMVGGVAGGLLGRIALAAIAAVERWTPPGVVLEEKRLAPLWRAVYDGDAAVLHRVVAHCRLTALLHAMLASAPGADGALLATLYDAAPTPAHRERVLEQALRTRDRRMHPAFQRLFATWPRRDEYAPLVSYSEAAGAPAEVRHTLMARLALAQADDEDSSVGLVDLLTLAPPASLRAVTEDEWARLCAEGGPLVRQTALLAMGRLASPTSGTTAGAVPPVR
jgi:hypothetical protein